MINLWHLQEKFQAVKWALQVSGGEITPEVTEAMEAMQVERDEKLVACACLFKNLAVEADAFKEQIANMKARATALEWQSDQIAIIVRKLLPTNEKFQEGTHKLSYSVSSAVVVTDEACVPPEFLRTKTVTEIDKKAITAALKADPSASIQGAEMEVRYNLQVK